VSVIPLNFKDRLLPPLEKRRRIDVKDCNLNGDPYRDVDEGIQEEVRIFNDVLGLKTYSSCEGHLSNKRCTAFIVSYIKDKMQLQNIRKAIKKENMVSMNPKKPHEVNDLLRKNQHSQKKSRHFKKYSDSYLITNTLARNIKGYMGTFMVKVKPYNTKMEQNEWDNIRRRRFKAIIYMLYNVNL
jgi:hypothetical protein